MKLFNLKFVSAFSNKFEEMIVCGDGDDGVMVILIYFPTRALSLPLICQC